ncbi:cell division protein FtsQ/DivIB [Xylanimonas sp. McL0601]|uniref:cell division protein FtsQ/DivIB n=1 Tax=Xylanimonas sp. McL0601 TaxID=3414739 RepID=UPI003CEC989E
MRPPARPRVPPKPAVAKSAMPAPAAPSGTPQRPAPQRPAPQQRAAKAASPRTEAVPRAPAPRPRDQTRGRPTVSTTMSRRLAEKRAMRRHRVLRSVALWVTSVAVAVGLGWAAFFSPLLALDSGKVDITGQGTTIDVSQVQAVVAEAAGIPLPRLDTVGLRERLLELNAVKDARILRSWPRGLDVQLTSREPVAAVPADDGVALVDPDGVRVGTVPEPPAGLPVVDVGLGPEDAAALEAALHVLAALPPELSAQVTNVTAATRDDVRTTLASGQEVRWGSDARIAVKVAVVQTLRQADPGARIFDVSSPDLPVTR